MVWKLGMHPEAQLFPLTKADSVSGLVEVKLSETTGNLTAVFLDEEGAVIDTDSDYELELHVEPESDFVTIERKTENLFVITVSGVDQGEATMHFELFKEHGEEDEDGHDHDDNDDHGVLLMSLPTLQSL